MIWNVVIFAALATTSLAKGSIECSFSEPGARCIGTTGQRLIFHLANTENAEIRLIKDKKVIVFKISKNRIVNSDKEYVTEPEVFTNGTVSLGRAEKRHSGDYLLEVFRSDGVFVKKVTVHLEVKDLYPLPVVTMVVAVSVSLLLLAAVGLGLGLMKRDGARTSAVYEGVNEDGIIYLNVLIKEQTPDHQIETFG